MQDDVFERVMEYAVGVFRCGDESIHGPAHWQRVDDTARLIAERSGADATVVRAFALLHDFCRDDDGTDPEHGPRAADRLRTLPDSLLILDPNQMNMLEYAIRHHTGGETSDDPTIGTCWDADRLDLGRVCITPHPNFMSTETGKEIAALGSKQAYCEKRGLVSEP